MTPALEAHLSCMCELAMRAEAIAGALNTIIVAPDLEDLRIEIAVALTQITFDLAEGLDTPQRFEVTS